MMVRPLKSIFQNGSSDIGCCCCVFFCKWFGGFGPIRLGFDEERGLNPIFRLDFVNCRLSYTCVFFLITVMIYQTWLYSLTLSDECLAPVSQTESAVQ